MNSKDAWDWDRRNILGYISFPFSESDRDPHETIRGKPHVCFPDPWVWLISLKGERCIRCDGTGLIPFFQVHTVLERQLGSIVSGRCSCGAGDRLSERIPRFDVLFPLEVHRTANKCQIAALEAETRWLREKHWPRLYAEVQEGAQKRGLRKVLGKAKVEELKAV